MIVDILNISKIYKNTAHTLLFVGKYVLANHALRDKKVILFYFAAGCDAPAMHFTPYLKEAYEVRTEESTEIGYKIFLIQASRVKGEGAAVEVILVSNVIITYIN